MSMAVPGLVSPLRNVFKHGGHWLRRDKSLAE